MMRYQFGVSEHPPVFFEVEHPGRARCTYCRTTILRGDGARVGWRGRYYHLRCWFDGAGGREFLRVAIEQLSDSQLVELGLEVERPAPIRPRTPDDLRVGMRIRILMREPNNTNLNIGDICAVERVSDIGIWIHYAGDGKRWHLFKNELGHHFEVVE